MRLPVIRKKGRSVPVLLVGLALLFCFLTGCGNRKIVLTTGFSEDEVFRIDDCVCTRAEVLVYLANLHNQYSKAYGDAIWDTRIGDGTLEESVKQTVLARLAKIKMMNLMAESYRITLEESEQEAVREAARDYYGRLTSAEISAMGGVDESTVERMYREYAIAEKVYLYLTRDVNTEVSDDEARTITVQQISLHDYIIDEDGNPRKYTAAEREQLRELAETLMERLADGEDFEDLSLSYNDEDEMTIGVSRGKSDETILEACAMLGEGEISPVVETEDGFHIYRCVSAYDRDQTEQRKEEILRERAKQAFASAYEAFAGQHESYLNEELWGELKYQGDTDDNNVDFFDIYSRYVTIRNGEAH